MRNIRILFYFLIVCLLASCNIPSSNNADIVNESNLRFTAENIGTIGTYGYDSSREGMNARVSGTEILSYAESGSSEFRPLVFETDNGTKIIFQYPSIRDIGGDYYLCQIGNVSIIRKEPTIVYEPTGEKDELGNDIMEQKTVIIDVERSYGSNWAMIDMNRSSAFLFSSVDGSGSSIDIHPDDFYQTDNAFYFIGNGFDGTAVFKLEKKNLSSSSPVIREMTNPSVFRPIYLDGASDTAMLVLADYSVPYIIDTEAHLSPSRILPDDYVYYVQYNGNTDEIRPFTRYVARTISTVCNDYVYSFSISSLSDLIGGVSMKVNNGELETYDCSYVPVGENYGFELELISSINKNDGVEMIMRHYVYDSGYYQTLGFARAFCHDGKIDMVYLPMPKEYRAADKFDVLDGKIYWIGNVDVQSGSSICYGDFDTKGVRSKIIPGKPVASSEFSISPDGSIVYLQYLSDVDVGTYSWNPEKESVPRLLMTTLGDVHSIVNISNL